MTDIVEKRGIFEASALEVTVQRQQFKDSLLTILNIF